MWRCQNIILTEQGTPKKTKKVDFIRYFGFLRFSTTVWHQNRNKAHVSYK